MDYGTALELYTLTLEKMKAQKIFTTQAGLKIVDELRDADTVTRQQIGQYVINMKAKQDSEIVKNIQSISFDKLSSPALHHLLFNMLSHKSVCSTVSQEPAATVNLSSAEIEGTKYVGGALIRSILKAKSLSAEVRDVVGDWVDEKDPSSWTVMQDRGALIYVSPRFSQFLISCDSACLPVLKSITGNCDMRQMVMDCILTSSTVKSHWNAICSLDDPRNSDLLYTFVRKYSTIRCKAFILSKKRKK